MDRNSPAIRWAFRLVRGQARKSLWIETKACGINLVIIDGQARKSLWIETGDQYQNQTYGIGQARKSLWIETLIWMQFPLAGTRSGS